MEIKLKMVQFLRFLHFSDRLKFSVHNYQAVDQAFDLVP